MNIIVEYDSKFGTFLPDGDVEDWIDRFIEDYKNVDGYTVQVANELIIHGLRVRVKTNQLSCTDIKFKYKGLIMEIDKDGRLLSEWPTGFCDNTEN